MRREIESFADVIFASSQAQRDFWLGERDLNPEEIRTRYGGLKPCLHGSDAHMLDDVAMPFGDRFSWIKGELEFDSLRQACIDPRGRSYVGAEPPSSATPSQVISEIEVIDSPWMQTPVIPLNAGLVAIIGARGSGKTALADVIAKYRHSWTIAEHTFRLLSWMLISCAVLAAGRHLKNDVIEYTGIFLCVIWVINFVIVCFRAMTGVQDEMIEWSHNGEENRVIKGATVFSVSMAVVILMSQLIPLTLKTFSEVYSNIKLF